MQSDFKIRRTVPNDAPALATLAAELGYPEAAPGLEQRLQEILADPQQAVFVAESPDGVVAGWVHALRDMYLEEGPFVEIGGLVVSESFRRTGIGRALMRAAEDWARLIGVRVVRLRSRQERLAAHTFYESLGYRVIKTQLAFYKEINAGSR